MTDIPNTRDCTGAPPVCVVCGGLLAGYSHMTGPHGPYHRACDPDSRTRIPADHPIDHAIDTGADEPIDPRVEEAADRLIRRMNAREALEEIGHGLSDIAVEVGHNAPDDVGRLVAEYLRDIRAALPVLERAVAERDEARAEALEEARLNGMGSEREAKLRAEVERLEAEAERLVDIDDGLADWNEQIRRQRDEARAEVERLRRMYDTLNDDRNRADAEASEYARQANGLRAEVERLREALRGVLPLCFPTECGAYAKARAALEEADA